MYPHKLLHAIDNDDFVTSGLSVKESDLGDWETSRVSDPQPPPKVLIQEH